MDYRELLIKYIQYIEKVEGVNYILTFDYPAEFTPEEWAELEALALIAREME